jgi:iron(III) transport system substrate-binding protein
MKKLIVFLVVATVAAAAVLAPSAVRAQDKAVFYANMTAIEPIIQTFNDSSDLKAEYTLMTEFQAGKLMADVLQAPLPVLEFLKAQGVLAPYASPAAAGYPEWTRTDGTIQIFGIEYVALIYNKELVKAADAPKRYEDLADPKWKDKIVMANPASHATTISWLIGLKEKVFASEEAWMAFVKGLAANNPMFVASFGPTPAPVESGEKLIAISMPKYIITKAPAPLDWARIDQPLLGSPRGIALAAKAPHPEAGKRFMDFWLSRPAMGQLADKVGEYVLTPGVFPPIDGIDKAEVLPVRELSDAEIEKWGAEFRKIFGAP